MRRALRIVPVVAAALFLGAADGEGGGDAKKLVGLLLGGGFVVAWFVALGLPVGLALHDVRREWVAKVGRAADRATTACAFAGAGLAVFFVLAVAVLLRAPFLAWIVLAAASLWFFAGFAGCARRHGERMLGASDGVRPTVLGWLARAGLFAVPVAWPVVAAYLVVVALGAPLVALFSKDEAPPVT